MGDDNRGKVFAAWVQKKFPKAKYILDVAGGKGIVAKPLAKDGLRVRVIDAQPRIYGNKNPNIKCTGAFFVGDKWKERGFDIVIGMHPDQATGEILVYAIKHRIPFAIVPCCVVGRMAEDLFSYKRWVTRLVHTARINNFDVHKEELDMRGANVVVYGSPR